MKIENGEIQLTAVLYMRYSSNMQNEQSIDGQRRIDMEYADKNGIEIIGEYIDRERSGRNAKRESFKKMIDDIQKHKINIDMIIVYKLDRFFRNENLHRKYEQILADNNVQLISATENVNEKNIGEKMVKSLMLLLNEEESKKISMNVARGKKETALKCKWCGGTAPLGYDVDKETKTLVINKNEAKIVRLAFRLRFEGFSYAYIIEKLNKKGYKTKIGNSFRKNSLFEIFRNIKYKGIYEYNKAAAKSENGTFNHHASKSEDEIIRIDGGCPAIVKAEIWDKVNQMSIRHSDIKPKGDYLLSGLAVCKCGSTMQVNRRNNHNKDYLSFFCPKHKNKDGCDAKEINYNQLEEFVLWQLEEKIFSKDTIETFLCDFKQIDEEKQKSLKKQIREAKSQIRLNKNKINNCIEKIENGCNSTISELLDDRITEITKENKKLYKKVSHLESNGNFIPTADEVMPLKDKFINYMKSGVNMSIRKAFLQEVIEKIEVKDDEIIIIYNL